MMQLRENLKKPARENLIKCTQSNSLVDFSFTFSPDIYLFLFVPFPASSAGAVLPEGGAGAIRRHEAIRQGDGTNGTRQIHRESRMLVCGRHGQQPCCVC